MGKEIVAQIRQDLSAQKDQIGMVLPKGIDPDKFIRVAMTAIQLEPSLQECTTKSLLGACMKCAQDGLIPDGREAALVKRWNKNQGAAEATYMPMVHGIIKKLYNSGEVKSVTSKVVYENDEFKTWTDDEGDHLIHVPDLSETRGGIKSVYAMARLRSGETCVEPLTKADIEKIRAMSTAKNSPWITWWEEMARKSAIRRLSKRLPISSDAIAGLQSVLGQDDQFYDLNAPDTMPDRKATIAKQIRQKIGLQKAGDQMEARASDEDTDIIEGEATEIPPHDAATGEIIDAEAEPVPQPANTEADAVGKRIAAQIKAPTATGPILDDLMQQFRAGIEKLPDGHRKRIYELATEKGWTGYAAQEAAE